MATWNPTPTIGVASWQGNPPIITKNQLLSTTAGLYNDLTDFSISSLTVSTLTTSTLTVLDWISTPNLYVSSIVGGGVQISNDGLTISTGNISLVSLSTLQFKGIDLGGVSFNFDLGLGNAIGGFLGGLGALVGGVFIGLGTGTGLAIQGITNGLFSLANTRGDSITNINSNVFETINGTTQLQISTLGDAYPLYSTIFRQVSSVSPNTVPGAEEFVSSFFLPGTTCVRAVSDPTSPLTTNSTINTSTIQSFGQWVPFIDPSVAGEDIYARKAQFSTVWLSNINSTDYPVFINQSNTNGLDQILSLVDFPPTVQNNSNVYSPGVYTFTQQQNMYTNRVNFNNIVNFISTPYTQYTSSIGDYIGGVYFFDSTITSTLSTIPKLTWVGAGGIGNFAICEFDESNFLSTFTMDLVAQANDIFLQWGLAVDNRNSTIATGTSKRVSWDNTANTSNFIDIPVPQSTTKSYALSQLTLQQSPFESRWIGQYTGEGLVNPDGAMAFAQKQMTFGDVTTFNNTPGYPYQFNGNVFVNGTLEADQLIALSTFTSTNIVTYFSTVQLDADNADIETAYISSLRSDESAIGNISSFYLENYSFNSQFSFISTLFVDFQFLADQDPRVKAFFNMISTSRLSSGSLYAGNAVASNLSSVNMVSSNLNTLNAQVSSLGFSTVQEISLTSIYNYPGAITAMAGNNTSPLVAISFKAQLSTNQDAQTRIDYNYNQITGTSNGANFYSLATFDPTLTAPNLWSLSNIATATFSNVTIDNAFVSTLVLSSIQAPNASYSNIQLSTLNNQNTNTLLQYLPTPNVDVGPSPSVWTNFFDFGMVSSSLVACPSIDVNLGCIAVGPDNPPNGGFIGRLGIIDKANPSNPTTMKMIFGRGIYASGNGAFYGGDVTLALKKGIDYDDTTSTFKVMVVGDANNPVFRVEAWTSNIFIRGYPY